MKNTESMTLKPLIENIKTYFNKIDSNMKKYVESIMDDANHKFDKAFEENKKGYITDISHWRSLQAKSNEINNILQDISIAKAG
jgi:ribosomal protein S17E